MPSSKINKKSIGFVPSVTDPEHPDYLSKCPLPIRVKIAGKQLHLGMEALGTFSFFSTDDDIDSLLEEIIVKNAIPLPLQVLEYARSLFMIKRLNPKNKEKPGILDLEEVGKEEEDLVKLCIHILNNKIDG
tara:strand:- start:7897 stop:8289 length:393 start_codon:yes stop_codon:yes gene_type:complete